MITFRGPHNYRILPQTAAEHLPNYRRPLSHSLATDELTCLIILFYYAILNTKDKLEVAADHRCDIMIMRMLMNMHNGSQAISGSL